MPIRKLSLSHGSALLFVLDVVALLVVLALGALHVLESHAVVMLCMAVIAGSRVPFAVRLRSRTHEDHDDEADPPGSAPLGRRASRPDSRRARSGDTWVTSGVLTMLSAPIALALWLYERARGPREAKAS